MDEKKETYILNGQELTEEEFFKKRNELTSKGVILIHESGNVYKTRLYD